MMKKISFTIACLAAIIPASRAFAQRPVVMLDCYFNNEWRKDPQTGVTERYHYTWEDTTQTGYSVWGSLFKKKGAALKSLATEPTLKGLHDAGVYVIVDPDTKKETAEPHYIEQKHIKAIESWVRAGGVLIILANDSANVELKHLNQLSGKFGIHFNDDVQNHVVNDRFEMGELIVPPGNEVFKHTQKLFVKDVASLTLSGTARPLIVKNNVTIMAVASYGKGTVFAVGDPCFYNEYCNGRLPAEYQNKQAAEDLAAWLIAQARSKK